MAGLVVVAVGLCIRGVPKEPDVDSSSYRRMAEGHMSQVVRPYANRVLHPLVVWGVEEVLKCRSSKVRKSGETTANGANRANENNFETSELQNFRTDPETFAFWIVAVASLVIALAALADLTPRLSAIPFAILVACPTLCLYGVNIYLQDLFALALTTLFFWALSAKRVVLSLLLLFLLQTTRESTVVIAAALVVTAAFSRQWRWMLGVCVALAAGTVFVATVSRDALPNIHAMSGPVYLLTKVVANGAENFLGITVWSDTYARQLPHFYPTPPVWQMEVPTWMPLGGMRSIGIFSIDCWRPLEVAVILLSAFGVLPTMLYRRGVDLLSISAESRSVVGSGWRIRIEEVVRVWGTQPLTVQIAVLAGAVFLLLSPFTGRTVERYIGYSWPLFWLALVGVGKSEVGSQKSYPNHAPFLWSKGFWVTNVVCMWWPVLLSRIGLPRGAVCLLGIVGVGVCYFTAMRWTQKRTAA